VKISDKELKKIEKSARNISTLKGFDYYVVLYTSKTIIPLCKGTEILELGPADGLMTKLLSERFKSITAVDASESLLRKARKYVGDNNVKFIESLFEKYSPEKKFDTIILSHVLEHVIYPVNLLKQVKIWLKKRGRIIICVPNALSLHRQIGGNMGLLKNIYALNEKDRAIGHYRIYDMKRLIKGVKKAGLKILNSGGILLKPLSNNQLLDFGEDYFDALYKLGKKYPEICSEIYVVVS